MMDNKQDKEQEQKATIDPTETVETVREEDPAEESEAAVDTARRIASLEEANKEKEGQLQALIERTKRLQADFENYKRRTQQEKEELSMFVTADIVAQLLPVIDNFDRAVLTLATADSAALQSGVEMIYRQFTQVMDKLGVTKIECIGQSFNPEFHEAVMRVEADDQEDGTIVEELNKGYSVRGRVVRPSMVKVASKS